MKTRIYTSIIAVLALSLVAVPAFSYAIDAAPASTGGGVSADTASSPTAPASTGDGVVSADTNPTAPAPTSTGGGTSADTVTPPADEDDFQSGGRTTNRRNTGTSNGGVTTPAGVVAGVTTTSCPLITDYLKLGGTNNPVQVTNLQVFLKNAEKLDVDVNGIFDEKTDAAVKAFQLKYIQTILGPWEATRATGFVYITTIKKINELACASPLTLSADELAIINEYKGRGHADSDMTDGTIGGSNATGTDQIGDTDSNEANTAATGEASILSRFWNFVKSLFR